MPQKTICNCVNRKTHWKSKTPLALSENTWELVREGKVIDI